MPRWAKFPTRALFVLWVSLLAFGLPEVFAGTGNGWLTRFDVYLLALPLYGLHFWLLVHIAVQTRRTSWPALYLFGIVFALYETWITKVIWHSYPGAEGFAFGGFGPWFGIHETVGLALFYHPVTSFLLPLAVVSTLFPAFGRFFPMPDWIFGTSRWALLRRVALVLVWGVVSGHNMPVPGEYLYSWLSLLVVLALGWKLLEKRVDQRVASPTLSRIGLGVAMVWLALIYGASYALLLPENLPPLPIQALTLAFYPVLALLIARTRPRAHDPTVANASTRGPVVVISGVFLTGLASVLILTYTPVKGASIGIIPFLAMIPLGAGLFIWLVIWQVLLHRQARE